MILQDRDGDTAWNAASDGTLEERVCYAQNWRQDVSALLTDDGRTLEWVKYSSYGVPWSLPAGDTDSDGDFDATDDAVISGGGTYDVRKDVNLDGSVDVTDFLDALDLNNGYSTLGWSKLGATRWGNRKGYAGYEGDIALAGAKWHVRHRVLESDLGRWIRPDLMRYIDGMNLYTYVTSWPIISMDPYGLAPINFEFNAFIPFNLGTHITGICQGVVPPDVPEYWMLEPFATNTYFATDSRWFGEVGTSRLYMTGSIESTSIGTVFPTVTGDRAKVGASHRLSPLWDSCDIEVRTADLIPSTFDPPIFGRRSCNSTLTISASAAYPFVPLSPAIDWTAIWDFSVTAPGRILVNISGNHDEFPFYEAIIRSPQEKTFYTYISPHDGPNFNSLNRSRPFSDSTEVRAPTPQHCGRTVSGCPDGWMPGCYCVQALGYPCNYCCQALP